MQSSCRRIIQNALFQYGGDAATVRKYIRRLLRTSKWSSTCHGIWCLSRYMSDAAKMHSPSKIRPLFSLLRNSRGFSLLLLSLKVSVFISIVAPFLLHKFRPIKLSITYLLPRSPFCQRYYTNHTQ